MDRIVKVISESYYDFKDKRFRFHRWGDLVTSSTEEPSTRTVAIIEDLVTGQVYTIDPYDIQFLSEEEASKVQSIASRIKVEKMAKQYLEKHKKDEQ